MDNFDNNDLNNFERQPNHEINTRHRRSRNELRSKYDDTEFAADFLANDVRSGNSINGAMIAGIVGLLSVVVALFTFPLVLGLVGIALGIYAVVKGNKVLGFLTIGIGVLAVVMPLFYTGPFISIF